MTGTNRRAFIKAAIAAPLAVKLPVIDAVAEPLPAVAAAPIHPWQWWFSYDGGEVYSEQFESMEAALKFLKSEGEGHIAECRQQDFDMELTGDTVFEALLGQNEEIIGEGNFLDGATSEQVDDLGRMVSAAIQAWVQKHNIDLTAWQFAGTRNKVEAKEVAPVKKAAV